VGVPLQRHIEPRLIQRSPLPHFASCKLAPPCREGARTDAAKEPESERDPGSRRLRPASRAVMRAGGQAIEVTRVRITEAGRRALAKDR